MGQAESAPTSDATAEQTRSQLEVILEKYPPAVGRVLKLDPSLMTNQAYMATYPQLSAYITQHPEIARNPSYFLDNVASPNRSIQRPEVAAASQFYGLLAGVAGFIAFLVITGIVVWGIRMIVTSRRWNKLSRAQYEVHSKLLDRFTSNEDLLAYMQTSAGRRFLEAAPVPPAGRAEIHGRTVLAYPLVACKRAWSCSLTGGWAASTSSSPSIEEPAELFSVAGGRDYRAWWRCL